MEELAAAHTQTVQAITDLEHLLDASSALALGVDARELLVQAIVSLNSHAQSITQDLSMSSKMGDKDGEEAAASSTKRMPDQRADGGEGPVGKRRKKARAADPSTSNTSSGKAPAQTLEPSAPKKRRTGEKLCEHQRRRRTCKDCGGSSICEHQRRRSRCKDCGGSGLCEHQRVRSKCKDCREDKEKASDGEM